MKKVLSCFILWLCCQCVQAQQSDAVYLGYCDGLVNTQGTGKSGVCQVSAAICLPKELLAMYRGCEISQIRVGLATWYSELRPDTLTAWVRTSLDTENAAAGFLTDFNYGWNVIDLSEPYAVSGDEDIYIGYSYWQDHSMNCISLTGISVPGGCWIAKNDVWTDFSSKDFGNVSVEAVVTGDALPESDLQLVSCQTNRISVKHGDAILVSGCVQNNSAQPVGGFRFRYSLNDEAQGDTLIQREMAYRDTCKFELRLPTERLAEGERMVNAKLTLLMADGREDSYMADNSAAFDMAMYTHSAKERNILLEQFTTERCFYCPSGGLRIQTAVEEGYSDRVVWVCHHVGYGTDKFTVDESKEYLAFYGDMKFEAAPALMLNRHYNPYSSKDGYPVQSVEDPEDITATFDYELQDPAFVSLSVETSAADGQLDIHVEGNRSVLLADLSPDPRLCVFVKESQIEPISQMGTYEGFVHNNTLRKVATSAWGDAIQWEGDDFAADYRVAVDENWNLDNVQVVAFVCNYSDDIMKRVVYNVVQSPLGSLSAIQAVSSDQEEERYYNLQGMPLPSGQLEHGIYIRQTQGRNGRTVTQKVVL